MNTIQYAEAYGEDGESVVAYSDSELQAAKEAIALASWEAMDEDAQSFLREYAADYIVGLARGGDSANETIGQAKRDCVGYLTEWATDRDARAWLDRGK